MDLISPGAACALLLGAAFLIGGIAGCLVAGSVHGQGGEALRTYLEIYLSLAKEGNLTVRFWQVVWEQVRILALAFALGFTAIGVAGIPMLFVLRGFEFAFSVACICRVFGAEGLVLALCLFGFPAILRIPTLFVLGGGSLIQAYRLLCRYTGGNMSGQGRDWRIYAVCAGAAMLCAALEYVMLPVLIGACAGIFV